MEAPFPWSWSSCLPRRYQNLGPGWSAHQCQRWYLLATWSRYCHLKVTSIISDCFWPNCTTYFFWINAYFLEDCLLLSHHSEHLLNSPDWMLSVEEPPHSSTAISSMKAWTVRQVSSYINMFIAFFSIKNFYYLDTNKTCKDIKDTHLYMHYIYYIHV